ncbi:MAG: SDR family oxidoreductase [candidate division NC10 bacterium]|nr:SDR family oxidoreductase [candidate division NC10 bacterium]
MGLYLVTGGAGFIGSHLVHALLQRGEQVRVLDDFSTGRRDHLLNILDQIELVEGSLADPHAVDRAVEGVTFILHQGARPSIQRSIHDPFGTHEANATGTLNLLVAARRAGVSRVVYASSSSVYGDTPALPKEERMQPEPRSPYAASKLAGELYCQVFQRAHGLETISLRYFNVFGPRQDPSSEYAAVIPKFITAMLAGRPPTIFGDGKQSRDFTYVQDVVETNLRALEAPQAPGSVMNVACGERHTLLQLVDLLNDILGTDFEPTFAPMRQGDVRHSHASTVLARGLLGYEPSVSFREGLERTVEWFKRHG